MVANWGGDVFYGAQQEGDVMAKDQGGHKSPHPQEVRDEALRIADHRGVEAAARELGLPPGTIRSWQRRRRLRDLRGRLDGDGEGLARLKREGRRLLARAEAERQAEERAAQQPEQPSTG
jgi:hypothetical protein